MTHSAYEYSLNIDRVSKRPYLVKEEKVDYPNARKMNRPDKIVDMMRQVYRIDDKATEHIYMITMNVKCDVTGVFLIGKGGVNSCAVDMTDVMTCAVLAGAKRIVIVHNHPSGDPSPSREDFDFTKKIATAGDMMAIQLLDSLIVGDESYVSVHETYSDWLEPMKFPVNI